MDWTEIKITVPAKNVETAENIANMAVPYGIYVEDYSNLEQETWDIAHIDLIDEQLLKKDRTKAVIHIYISPEDNPNEAISFLSERYAAEKIEYGITDNPIKEEDWANNWKKYFKPTPVGKKILIRPIWEDNYDSAGRIVLNLEPGIAFGTGTHETTRLCLELAEEYIKNGSRVLDVGCGSGILSAASFLLGAKTAAAVDIDPNAVKVAYGNASLNNIGKDIYTVYAGDIVTDKSLNEKIGGGYDVIFANIVADVIIAMSDIFPEKLSESGVLITSGIILQRKEEVIKALKASGLKIIREEQKNGWAALVCKK